MQALGLVEAAFDQHMMAIVLEGNPIRELAAHHDATQLAEQIPKYRNPKLVELIIEIANRFEALIREGVKTSQALKQMRSEGLMDRYIELVDQKMEVH